MRRLFYLIFFLLFQPFILSSQSEALPRPASTPADSSEPAAEELSLESRILISGLNLFSEGQPAQPDFQFSLNTEAGASGAGGNLSYRDKEKFLFEAGLKLAPGVQRDSRLDVSRFKGVKISPSLLLRMKELGLQLDLSGNISPDFTPDSFRTGNYSLSNNVKYNLEFDFLNLINPVKRSYQTSVYIRGEMNQKSGIRNSLEMKSTSTSSMRAGFHFEKGSVVDVNMGFLLKNREEMDLTLRHPVEQSQSRLNLNMNVGLNFDWIKVKVDFSPMLNRIGPQQDIMHNLFSLAADIRL